MIKIMVLPCSTSDNKQSFNADSTLEEVTNAVRNGQAEYIIFNEYDGTVIKTLNYSKNGDEQSEKQGNGKIEITKVEKNGSTKMETKIVDIYEGHVVTLKDDTTAAVYTAPFVTQVDFIGMNDRYKRQVLEGKLIGNDSKFDGFIKPGDFDGELFHATFEKINNVFTEPTNIRNFPKRKVI